MNDFLGSMTVTREEDQHDPDDSRKTVEDDVRGIDAVEAGVDSAAM